MWRIRGGTWSLMVVSIEPHHGKQWNKQHKKLEIKTWQLHFIWSLEHELEALTQQIWKSEHKFGRNCLEIFNIV